jgi:predicted phosphodiesterase
MPPGKDVTDYVCMGDVVGYNADPVACLERVRAMDCPTVKGNHDEDASGSHSLDSMNPVAAAALEWTREQLTDEQRTWLRRLRMVRQVEDFTVVHSTLDQPAHWNYVTNRFDAMSNFSYQFTQVCFHGHTHVPRVYVKTDKVQEIPGRVGDGRGRFEVFHQCRLRRPAARRRLARLLCDLRPRPPADRLPPRGVRH